MRARSPDSRSGLLARQARHDGFRMRFRLGIGYGFHHGPRIFALFILVLVMAALVRTRRYSGPRRQAWNSSPGSGRASTPLATNSVSGTRGAS